MTNEEMIKLKQIIYDKFIGIDDNHQQFPWLSTRMQTWKQLLEDREITYLGSNMNITTWINNEIRISDPAGGTLRLTEDQARKILMLGL